MFETDEKKNLLRIITILILVKSLIPSSETWKGYAVGLNIGSHSDHCHWL